MYKCAAVMDKKGMDEAVQIMDRVYRENPSHWPHGLDPYGFDGGLYLIREKQTNKAAGFCGWQQRNELQGDTPIKVGYYSIGILPEHRRHGYARQALQKLIAVKSAGVDCVRAMIVSSNAPSLALADKLGVEKLVKKADAARVAEGTGAVAGGAGVAGILSTGLGKAAPSFVDLAHQMMIGPSGGDIFSHLAGIDSASAAKLEHIARKSPTMFKLALMGVKLPGVDVNTQKELMRVAFSIRPSNSTLGDVAIFGDTAEVGSGMGRLRHALTGNSLHHSAVGLPSSMDSWAFNAGRNQGVQMFKGNLSDAPPASVTLRAKANLPEKAMIDNINESVSKPYSYGRLHRLAAQELVSTPWSQREMPTFLEKTLDRINLSPRLRKHISAIPGMRSQLTAARAAQKLCPDGHTCSTGIAEALQKTNPSLFHGKSPLGVAPADFLRQAGKDFNVVSVNLPEALASRKQLLINHLMKAGPMASRLAIATPLIGGSAYLAHKAFGKQEPEQGLVGRLRSAFYT